MPLLTSGLLDASKENLAAANHFCLRQRKALGGIIRFDDCVGLLKCVELFEHSVQRSEAVLVLDEKPVVAYRHQVVVRHQPLERFQHLAALLEHVVESP